MLKILLITFFPWLMLLSASSDFFTMTISNRISLALIAGFLVLAPFVGMDLHSFGMHLLAGLIMLVICFVLFAFNIIGGGDAKLAACTTLWLGWDLSLEYIILFSLCGGLLTLGLLAVRNMKFIPVTVYRFDFAKRLLHPRGDIPYGIALAVAALILYPKTIWFSVLY